jgi:hypothetical protein
MPDPNAQIPTPDELIGKGIDRLVALRPRALDHINGGRGRYSHVFAGWRAQGALLVRRLADLAKNGRLSFAEAAALRELAGSEFDTLIDLEPAVAVGQVTMTRAGTLPGGTVRQGALFSRPADESSQKLYAGATYTAAVDTFVRQGDTTVTVPLVAARAGSFANRPYVGTVQTELEVADNIVDAAAWTVTSYEMGGGSDGVSDDDVRRYARAYAQGQYGPTERASIAGSFRAGAKRAIAVDDPTVAAQRIFIADQSWAGSTRWTKLVRQRLADDRFIGFGCKVLVSFVTNQLVAAEVTCKVRRPEYLNETSSLDVAIQKAIRAYFDNRPDWNRWKASALRGVVARADRRLLSCSSVVIKTLAGVVVSEPTVDSATHYMLLGNGVTGTYLSPT